ncbi:uncharacterized protein [Hoplias malabaricus]|uniref:uncharacterized protein isoform X2 n=1 Tax=Hoplias malabaricus TaxID=27720 RepID=UPI003462662D
MSCKTEEYALNKNQPEMQPLTIPLGKTLKFFTDVAGNTLKSDVEFKRRLCAEVPWLEEVSSEGQCDLILFFCPIVSRSRTDIEAALLKLRAISAFKPAVLVVLHYTFKQDTILPDSWRSVTRKDTLTVDCLFNEDEGLLTCSKNQQALQHIKRLIKPQPNAANRDQTKLPTFNKASAAPSNKGLQEEMNSLQMKMKTVEQKLVEEERKHENKCFTKMILATKLKLVLVGKTGSAVEHLFLDREERSQAGASIGRGQGWLAGREVTVVDTPEKLRDNEELMDSLTAQEPHAFLLVIPENQATEEARNMVEKMEEIFGERCWRKAMVLFIITGEGLGSDDKDLHVQRLVEKCRNRSHILIENGDGGQVSGLLETVDQMLSGNRSSSEICDMIGRVEKIRRESHKMLKALKKNDEYIHGFVGDLSKLDRKDQSPINKRQIVNQMKTRCEIRKTIWERIRTLYERVSELGEDRDFIKFSMLGEQQTFWLSVPSEELRKQTDEELKILKDLFFSEEMCYKSLQAKATKSVDN